MTDRERADLAVFRFKDLAGKGRLTPIAEVAHEFNREEALVSRSIAEAFSRGLVSVEIRDAGREKGQRLPDLERRLKEKYSHLRLCKVIDAPPGSNDPLMYSDSVHRRLGLAMAEQIYDSGLIRDDELIGIGSGRGVYETVRGLQRLPPLRNQGVTLAARV